MHLYYNPYHNSEAQQLSSAVFRIEYLYNELPIEISNLETPIQIRIPKLDQSFADTSANHTCLQWNKEKQIWDEDGIVQSRTIDCKFYVVCFARHFSDFGFEVQPTKNATETIVKGLKNIIETSFDFGNFFQNAAFAISMTIFLLFFAFMVVLCVLSKRDDTLRSLHKTRQQRIQTDGSQY